VKRYEQSTRVITAFFSVLLGFGLKNLLDPKALDAANARWPCFLMSVFLFLRFLLGSSNHMWLEFVHPDDTKVDGTVTEFNVSRFQILKDFFFLVIFGLVGMTICYSTTVEEFLNGNLRLTGIALVWVFINLVIGCFREMPPGKWSYWLWVNLAQFFSILVVHCFVIPRHWGTIPYWLSFSLPGPAWEWSLFILVVVYLVIFTWDFSTQLKILKGGPLAITPKIPDGK
jgi:hypothetical protein